MLRKLQHALTLSTLYVSVRCCVAIGTLAFFASSPAQTSGSPELAKKLVNQPSVNALYLAGDIQQHEQVKDPTVQGGLAVRMTVTSAGQPWQAAALSGFKVRIAKGDQLFAAVWLKDVVAPGYAAPGKVRIGLEETSPPYTGFGSTESDLTGDWKLYQLKSVSPKDYEPGKANLVIQFGAAKQIVMIGPAFVLDLGPDATPPAN